MSHAGSGANFGASALSRSAHLVAQQQAGPSRPLRIPRAEHWTTPGVPEAPRRSAKRDARVDSKVEPEVPALPTGDVSPVKEPLLFFALPVTIRSQIYSGASADEPPVDFLHVLQTTDLKFDLRTEDGCSGFQTFCIALGRHAWSVRSLTLTHWTVWWGFGDNAWTSCQDSTQFFRGPLGELVISRTVEAPLHETCGCSTSTLLSQYSASFNHEGARAMTNIQQFVNALRSNDDECVRPTLLDAAQIFADLLQHHSRILSRDYGLAGNECRKCIMPRLYLCGHLSTRTVDESDAIVFDSRGRSRRSVASN